MQCLVTGGAGFIGSHLVDALIARGDRVTVVDDLSRGKRENLEQAIERGAELRVGDVRDVELVAELFATSRPEVVFHLAAQVDVRYSVEHPPDDASANVLGTIAVLEGARAVGTRRRASAAGAGRPVLAALLRRRR